MDRAPEKHEASIQKWCPGPQWLLWLHGYTPQELDGHRWACEHGSLPWQPYQASHTAQRVWRREHAMSCMYMNDQSLRLGKAKQLRLKTTPFFSREKEELPQAGFKPATFCILGRRSTN